MRRVTVLAIVGVMVLAGLTATGLAQDSQTAPGAKFAGVVGVQGAEVQNEIAERSFSERLAAADSNASRAAVVAAERNRISDQLDRLAQRKEQLQAARENGSISEGEYRARMAELAAQSRGLERRANRTVAVAKALPDEVLSQQGINVTRIQKLSDRARELTDGETATIAREIAGTDVGDGLSGPGDGPPSDTGGNETDETDRDENRGGDDRPGNETADGGRGTDAPGGGGGY